MNNEKESKSNEIIKIQEGSIDDTPIIADQNAIDEMLIQLLFNNRNTLISSSVVFDPALRFCFSIYSYWFIYLYFPCALIV